MRASVRVRVRVRVRERELRSLFRNYLIHPIYTCWSKCRCHTTGTNRLRNRYVTSGMQQQECSNRNVTGGVQVDIQSRSRYAGVATGLTPVLPTAASWDTCYTKTIYTS